MNYTILSTNLLIWAVFLGIVLASVCITIQKRTVCTIINTLIDSKCMSIDSAKTFDKLEMYANQKINSKVFISYLKSQNGLKRIVRVLKSNGEVIDLTAQNATIFSSDSFFIECENIQDVQKKYTYKKSNPFAVAALIIVLAIIAAIATYLVPVLTNYANTTVDSFKKGVSVEQTSPSPTADSQQHTNADNNQNESADIEFPDTAVDTDSDSDTEKSQDQISEKSTDTSALENQKNTSNPD